MSEQIKYLKSNTEISDVLAQGFAHIYHEQPQFPITFLAQYLKNHEQLKKQKKELIRKLVNNQTLSSSLKKDQEKRNKERQANLEKIKIRKERDEAFEFRIKQSANHQQILNQFCQWIEKERELTGVYIGELESQTKKIDLLKEDGEQAHIDVQAPKIIKFKAASHSHNTLMIGRTLTQESVIGRLLSQKNQQAAEGQNQQGKQPAKPKGEVYIPLVQQNKDLIFFRYPRLGSFFAVVMKVKSYLHQKIFDANIVKTQTYRKAKEEYDKEQEERQNKFRAMYDERAASGADQKQLEELQRNFEKEEEEITKPKEEEFQYILRNFVVCFDTLGLDKQITSADRDYCRNQVQILKNSWEKKQKQLLKKDIDAQLKLLSENMQVPQQEALIKLIEEQDKQLPSNEEVEKQKANQKLMELEINTLRIEKLKEYMGEEKYVPYLELLLDRRIIKYAQIMKFLYYFAGFSKEQITIKGTNIINWLKVKTLLTKEQLYQKINHYVSRGSKPILEIQPYAKWQRVLKNLQKYDLNAVATYNIYLAFILRFLLICGKVRIADNQARKAVAKLERQAREERIRQIEVKAAEKQQKMQIAKGQTEAKEEVFDEQAWSKTYDEQNPPMQAGQEIIEQGDADLQQEAEAVPP